VRCRTVATSEPQTGNRNGFAGVLDFSQDFHFTRDQDANAEPRQRLVESWMSRIASLAQFPVAAHAPERTDGAFGVLALVFLGVLSVFVSLSGTAPVPLDQGLEGQVDIMSFLG